VRKLADTRKGRKVFAFLRELKGIGNEDTVSQLAQLNLYQKDPASWNIVAGGASGKMKYIAFDGELDFVFNGKGLEPGLAYSLVYNTTTERNVKLAVLGSAVAEDSGNVHLSGSLDSGRILRGGDNLDVNGLWLVDATDIDIENARMANWNPRRYLFGHDILKFGE
jgi:hypothetical protein